MANKGKNTGILFGAIGVGICLFVLLKNKQKKEVPTKVIPRTANPNLAMPSDMKLMNIS
ncbi:MAG: hypothetical protein ACKVOU_03695 [Cytophagales bacterium]